MSQTPGEPAGEAPPGFIAVRRAPFIDHVGPILQAAENPSGQMRLGLRVAPVHANTLGLMHGGMISALVDSAMARALVTTLGRRAVTLRMTLEFLQPVRVGDWVEALGRLAAEDGETGNTECDVTVRGELCAHATGVFRLLRTVRE